jgi:putative ATPase
VAETRNEPVPLHLRNAPTKLMKGLGYGKGYKYAHDFEEAQVDQEHFPPNLQGRRYYEPTNRGFEATARERLAWRDERPPTTDRRPPSGGATAPSAAGRQQSAGDDSMQALAGEESQDYGDDDGAQLRRPNPAAKRPGKRGG